QRRRDSSGGPSARLRSLLASKGTEKDVAWHGTRSADRQGNRRSARRTRVGGEHARKGDHRFVHHSRRTAGPGIVKQRRPKPDRGWSRIAQRFQRMSFIVSSANIAVQSAFIRDHAFDLSHAQPYIMVDSGSVFAARSAGATLAIKAAPIRT